MIKQTISNQTNFQTSSGSLLWLYFDCALLLLRLLLGYRCSLLTASPFLNDLVCVSFFYLFFIYLFVFPGLVTLSIPPAGKLHYCRNITS